LSDKPQLKSDRRHQFLSDEPLLKSNCKHPPART